MNVFRRSRVLDLLGSMGLTLLLLALFAIVISVATFIEADIGTEGARVLVYNNHWFEGLLIALGVNIFLSLARRYPFRMRSSGLVIVHVAIIVILVGAALTRYRGYEGIMSIREGETAGFMYSRGDHLRLRIGDEISTLPSRFFRTGEQSYARELDLAGHLFRITVDEYWLHHESRLAPAPVGSPGLCLTVDSAGESLETDLLQGKETQAGEFRVWYLSQILPPLHDYSYNGKLLIKVGESEASLPVPTIPPSQITVDGYQIAITDFESDFQVGGASVARALMSNPMIEILITAPDGTQEQRTLFTYFPELSSQQTGVTTVETSYEIARTLLIAGGEEGFRGRCSVPLEIVNPSGGESGAMIAAGEEFSLSLHTVFRSEGIDGGFEVREFIPVARWLPMSSDDQNAPAAMKIGVEDEDGNIVQAYLTRGMDRWQEIELPAVSMALAFGPKPIALPFDLHLDDFLLKTYPGSKKPAGYESRVRLFDRDRGIQGEPALIAMNHPLSHRGFKVFQSSYDEDLQGTILSVNFDPGTWPTYLGYALITIGFLLSLLKDLIWSGRRADSKVSGGTA